MRNYTNLSTLDVKCKKIVIGFFQSKTSSTIFFVLKKVVHCTGHTHNYCTLITAIFVETSEVKRESENETQVHRKKTLWTKQANAACCAQNSLVSCSIECVVSTFEAHLGLCFNKKPTTRKAHILVQTTLVIFCLSFFSSATNHGHFLLEKFKANHLSAKLCSLRPMCLTFYKNWQWTNKYFILPFACKKYGSHR